MLSRLISVILLVIPMVSAAQGLCRFTIAPQDGNIDLIRTRLYVLGLMQVPELRTLVDFNSDNPEPVVIGQHFYGIDANTRAVGQIAVNNAGANPRLFPVTALFDGHENIQNHQIGNVNVQLRLQCVIVHQSDSTMIEFSGNERLTIFDPCSFFSKRGASSAFAKCSEICFQCIYFDGPSTSETYKLKLPNGKDVSIKGRHIIRRICHLQIKGETNVLKVQRLLSGRQFSIPTTLKLKPSTRQTTQNLDTYMTSQCL